MLTSPSRTLLLRSPPRLPLVPLSFHTPLHRLLSTSMSTPAAPPAAPTSSSSSSSSPPLQKTLPIFKDGRYSNPPWPTWRQASGLSIARMILAQQRAPNPINGVDLDLALPVVRPILTPPSPPHSVTYTWLSHASALIHMHGLAVLIDPVFTERCGPASWLGPKRHRPTPCSIEELPALDVVLISCAPPSPITCCGTPSRSSSRPLTVCCCCACVCVCACACAWRQAQPL